MFRGIYKYNWHSILDSLHNFHCVIYKLMENQSKVVTSDHFGKISLNRIDLWPRIKIYRKLKIHLKKRKHHQKGSSPPKNCHRRKFKFSLTVFSVYHNPAQLQPKSQVINFELTWRSFRCTISQRNINKNTRTLTRTWSYLRSVLYV